MAIVYGDIRVEVSSEGFGLTALDMCLFEITDTCGRDDNWFRARISKATDAPFGVLIAAVRKYKAAASPRTT